jgi:hypothetical protein
MSIVTLLIVILLIGLILSVFNGGTWGWSPSYLVGILLIVLIVLVLTGNVSL